ncbi:hypothetical protein [Salinibacterium sp. ZJ450]|uniref:hypothetical protein n=1 Tax=Salinibacterium sp. ZJ450 TaxID=2708338 RepID=UPI0014224923|nr:hypothetical protein [Salinibacterium sp. ZJ450]
MTLIKHSRSAIAFALLVGVLSIAGCATPDPAVSDPGSASEGTPTRTTTPTPTPTEAPAATAAKVVIGAEQFTVVTADGTVLHDVPFSAPATAAIDVLSEVFAEIPTTVEDPGEQHCEQVRSIASWEDGAFRLEHGPDMWMLPPGITFLVNATAESVGGVTIESSTGYSVGEPSTDLRDPYLAGDQREWFGFEEGEESVEDNPWGVFGYAVDGVLQRVTGGSYMSNPC